MPSPLPNPGAPRSTRPSPSRVQPGAPPSTVPPPANTRPPRGAPLFKRPAPSQLETGAPKAGAPKTDAPISKPPHNPGLRSLIAAKRAWSEPLSPAALEQGFLGWHARGYLPHHDVPGVTQFVTFRLDDAMPASRRSEWEAFLHLENDRERRTQLEAYLDRGLGECWLRRPEIAQLTCDALKFFAGDGAPVSNRPDLDTHNAGSKPHEDAGCKPALRPRYRLDAWVVMPNHVHVLVEVWQTPLAELLHSWKRFIAREANKILGRTGRFWEREYWETRIRDVEHLRQARRYIENNPTKAKLVLDPAEWPWSSAHARVPEGSAK